MIEGEFAVWEWDVDVLLNGLNLQGPIAEWQFRKYIFLEL